MEKRIDLERRGKEPKDIKELILDNCRSTTIIGLTDAFSNLESLSLINVGLTSLKGFPKLPNLKKLELSDNRINNGLNALSTSPKLTYLNLSGNKIRDLEALQPLKDFRSLKNLDLFNNDVQNLLDNYRDKIFRLIPSLKYLDGFDAEDREAEDSEAEEEVNGNEDESEEEASCSDEDDYGHVGLGTIYSENLDDMSDEDDYEDEYESVEESDVEAVEEESFEDEEEDEAAELPSKAHVRGKKRKLEDVEPADN
ncbi:PREDICTED: acidic leucine-rich nuclear phosphoprotein 32 family member A [Nicrophorus vespilloides]|uniref:Acidic leucine-rich nuclear phosphoprotein 32 family member A n=1 Tax=Nicrophorus vespilloides TaxID=110193 RepID=A0ABM1MZZ6_NICVS|nr:PREDICTED: acidic leucine-rich nuclear phosphoprotein 32 family member A [Nicrophorus vespilloides]XP_017780143.1 PREDICTED: acidic leucine-rich nuclear phosphoprotein 32 family member A [Nicrophorus vespilloides]XP_017780144.1 PREDICTED: acidic leucine-rich nuclear phosphoprotein 32 family member A [Nicrophorus vespilloides]XP_017780146.1 PREDICTED: acidic leucine-rich nuclear phosphoprotein 32 family member A [Nicrophorus vespilloides]